MNQAKETNVFTEMGNYWSEIADNNFTKQQIQFLKSILGQGLILDLACGTGRHTIQLGKTGFNIIGLDVSAKLLRIAKSRDANLQLIQADMHYLPFTEGVFGFVISMDNSFGYLPSETADLQSLKDQNRILVKGGLFALDVFNYEHLLRKYRKRRLNPKWLLLPLLLRFNNSLSLRILFWLYSWRQYPSFCLLQKRTVNKKPILLCDLWIIKDKTEKHFHVFQHFARLYRLDRLREMLESAGFFVKQAFGDYEKQEYYVDSKRLIILSEKK